MKMASKAAAADKESATKAWTAQFSNKEGCPTFDKVVGGCLDGSSWTDKLGKRKKVPFSEIKTLMETTVFAVPAKEFGSHWDTCKASLAAYKTLSEKYSVDMDRDWHKEYATKLKKAGATKYSAQCVGIMVRKVAFPIELRTLMEELQDAAETDGIDEFVHPAMKALISRAINMQKL